MHCHPESFHVFQATENWSIWVFSLQNTCENVYVKLLFLGGGGGGMKEFQFMIKGKFTTT
jgi:hypothetical protein